MKKQSILETVILKVNRRIDEGMELTVDSIYNFAGSVKQETNPIQKIVRLATFLGYDELALYVTKLYEQGLEYGAIRQKYRNVLPTEYLDYENQLLELGYKLVEEVQEMFDTTYQVETGISNVYKIDSEATPEEAERYYRMTDDIEKGLTLPSTINF